MTDPADELERHAAAARAARLAVQEQAEAVHRRMQQAAHYFSEFATQMNIIAPRARQTMELTGLMRFPDLVIRDLFVEERTRSPADLGATLAGSLAAPYEYVLLSFHYAGPRKQRIERVLAPEIERLEEQLAQHRVRYELNYVRNARAQIERAVFDIESDISAGVKFIPDYDRARVRIALRNIDRLSTWDVAVPITAMNLPLYEELARCVLGQPNEFRRMALGERPAPPGAPAATAKD